MAEELSYSPDSSHAAYVPFTNFRENWDFQRGLKHYRGGTASPIWIANLADSSIEKLPRKDSNDSTPMWFGNRIYFLSDRNGPVNLYRLRHFFQASQRSDAQQRRGHQVCFRRPRCHRL